MKKRVTRSLSLMFVIIMMVTMLTACGSSDGGVKNTIDDLGSMSDGVSAEGGFGDWFNSDSEVEYEPADKSESTIETGDSESVDSSRKIIERISMSVQTKEFDALMTGIDTRIAEFGGYVESSDVYGNGFDTYGNRDARIVIRIPSDKSDAFVDFVSENSAVTNKTVTTDDVTLQYVDVESRISALNLEKTSLENLLAEATTMEDIIYVQEKLMDVIYELESAQSQLRTFDNLIDYTTITLSVYEVDRTVVVEEQTAWEEIATRFTGNVEDIKDAVVDGFIFVMGESPYLLIYVIVIGIIVLIIKLASKNMKKPVDASVTVEPNANVDADAVRTVAQSVADTESNENAQSDAQD